MISRLLKEDAESDDRFAREDDTSYSGRSSAVAIVVIAVIGRYFLPDTSWLLSQKQPNQIAVEKLEDECSEPENNGACKEAKHEKRNNFLAVHVWEITKLFHFVSAQMRITLAQFVQYS